MTKMKFRSILICLLLGSISVVKAQNEVDSNFHLYLLIGQSNMAGRAPLDEQSKVENPQILVLDSLCNWVVAKDPLHFDKPKDAAVGPGISFATEMLKANKNIRIGLIPCAWGGSPINVWQPGAEYFRGHPYDDAVARTKIATQKGVLKGILWHQGESDNDSVRAPQYLSKLKTLVERFRSDLNEPQMPFVVGEIGYFNKANLINQYIDEVPQLIANTAVVSAKGLTDKGDHLHFNTVSARELGKRYAAAMQDLQSSNTKK